MVRFVKVCSKNDVKPGQGKRIEVNGKDIAIINDKGKFYAIDNTCAHIGPLCGSKCNNKISSCPLHAWEYELKTGKNIFEPDIKLNIYEVKVEGKDILINPKPKQ